MAVTRLYGPDYKPVTVNVQRLRPYHESELNSQVHPEAPEDVREKVPSQEPDSEDEEFDEVEAYRKLLLAASTVALLGKKLQLEDDRQRTNPIVAAEGMECETGGAKELPETLETADNLHRPLDSGNPSPMICYSRWEAVENLSFRELLTLGRDRSRE